MLKVVLNRSYGFSVKETANLINENNHMKIAAQYQKQEERLKQENEIVNSMITQSHYVLLVA
ncbi:hypothetical protein [Alkaliphilus metalliredigens]|uniref:hypothetical protein n=1 Tax=Alkaliphilus metalliredigens TaxID=208226 RepID=UPI0002E2232F|nr:hypothetical protein [Alkaliphilus metalliredigens]